MIRRPRISESLLLAAGEPVDTIQAVSTEWLLEWSRMLLAEYCLAVDERRLDAAHDDALRRRLRRDAVDREAARGKRCGKRFCVCVRTDVITQPRDGYKRTIPISEMFLWSTKNVKTVVFHHFVTLQQ